MRACVFASLPICDACFMRRHDPQGGVGRHQRRVRDKAEWASAPAAGNLGSRPGDKGHGGNSRFQRPSGCTGCPGPTAALGQGCLTPAGAAWGHSPVCHPTCLLGGQQDRQGENSTGTFRSKKKELNSWKTKPSVVRENIVKVGLGRRHRERQVPLRAGLSFELLALLCRGSLSPWVMSQQTREAPSVQPGWGRRCRPRDPEEGPETCPSTAWASKPHGGGYFILCSAHSNTTP